MPFSFSRDELDLFSTKPATRSLEKFELGIYAFALAPSKTPSWN